jgi:hypothetical protein
LWGDWFILQAGRAIGDNLVAIEAYNDRQYGDYAAGFPPTNDSPFTIDPQNGVFETYTFYGRYVSGLGTDQRESLAI